MAGGINIASLFATVGVDTSGLQGGLGKAKTALEGFGGNLVKQIATVASLTAAVKLAGDFIKSSVTDWADYADSMRMSAQLAGIATEEMSRLAQAADDFRVPIGTMQKSMEMALKNGFLPTIENIALLSDELLAISDPAQRAAIASKIFGKSYADMMPFLLAGGDAIREGTAAIDDSLVVTAEGAQQAKEYKDQVDNIGDAWTGVKNEVGKSALPVLTDAMLKITQKMQLPELITEAGGNIKKLQQLNLISADESRKLLLDLSGMGEGVSGMDVGEKTEYYRKIVQDTSTTLLEAQAAHDAYAQAMSGSAQAADNLATSTTDVGKESVLTKAKIEAITEAYEDQKKVLEEGLIDAQMNLNISIKTFRQGVASDLVQGLKDGGLQGEALIGVLTEIDKYAGTSYTVEYKMELAMDGLIQQILDDPTSVTDALAVFDDTFLPLQQSVIAAQGDVDALQTKLNDLEKQYNIDIVITTTGSLPNAPTDNWTWDAGTGTNGLATGGIAFGNTPYLVGERGPELFVPDTTGRIVANNQVGAMGDSITNYYTLNMPTTANAADVRTAFELMEAWA